MSVSPLASVSATRQVLEQFGLATKKALGQHFLIDDNVVRKIVELACIDSADTVLEVGPGIGTLTVALLSQGGPVISIERDADLPQVLSYTCAEYGNQFALVQGDALQITSDQLAQVCTQQACSLPTLLVSNLPYGVAATVVLHYFETLLSLQSATVMVQSEVADRMMASVGTKDYGAYTVKLGMRAQAVSRFEVAPTCFYPPPHVGSAVIKLQRRQLAYNGNPAQEELIQAACFMADAAFSQRRKNIRNAITGYFSSRGLDKEMAAEILEQAGITPSLRAEALTLDEYLSLGAAYLEFGK